MAQSKNRLGRGLGGLISQFHERRAMGKNNNYTLGSTLS